MVRKGPRTTPTNYHKNNDPKYEQLTNLVIDFKENSSANNFIQISKLTSLLVYNILRQYNMLDEDPATVEDIREDCRTIVLIKAINSYDKTRGASFCTHYVWQLRSYVRWKRNVYYKRTALLKALSLNQKMNQDNEATLAEVTTKLTPTTTSRVKREFHKWISAGKRYINYKAFSESYNKNPKSFDKT